MRRFCLTVLGSMTLLIAIGLLTVDLSAQTILCPDRAVDTGKNATKQNCFNGPLVICNQQPQRSCSGDGSNLPAVTITSDMFNRGTKVVTPYMFCYRLTVCNWYVDPDNPENTGCIPITGGSNVSTPQPTTINCPP